MLPAQVEEHFHCPYCGEPISVLLDLTLTDTPYVEDCEVCCRPIELCVSVEGEDWQLFTGTEGTPAR